MLRNSEQFAKEKYDFFNVTTLPDDLSVFNFSSIFSISPFNFEISASAFKINFFNLMLAHLELMWKKIQCSKGNYTKLK